MWKPWACRARGFPRAAYQGFIDKVRDIVGLYLDPPQAAMVLAVDEKSQMQTLHRTAPVLPLMPAVPGRTTHDYIHHGTTSLFAALDITTGTVIGQHQRRHRHQEFLRFLKTIDANTPKDLDLHLICDNYATHKTPAIKTWLAAHPRFHLHVTPTYSSWLTIVERWFAELTNRKLRHCTHHSVKALEADVTAWIQAWNDDPKPFVWTKTADEILANLAHYLTRINQLANDSAHKHGPEQSLRSAAISPMSLSRQGRPLRSVGNCSFIASIPATLIAGTGIPSSSPASSPNESAGNTQSDHRPCS
jgi:transposase